MARLLVKRRPPFDVLRGRNAHRKLRGRMLPQTSLGAYREIQPRLPSQRERVFHAVRNAGKNGLTDDEIQEITGIDRGHTAARRLEVERDGLIFWSGRTRQTRDGFDAMVWVSQEIFPHAPRRPEIDADARTHKKFCPACGRGRKPNAGISADR